MSSATFVRVTCFTGHYRKVFPVSSNPDSESMLGDRISRDLLAEQRARTEADI